MDQRQRNSKNSSGRDSSAASSGDDDSYYNDGQSDIELFNSLLSYPLLTGFFFGIGYQLAFSFLKKKICKEWYFMILLITSIHSLCIKNSKIKNDSNSVNQLLLIICQVLIIIINEIHFSTILLLLRWKLTTNDYEITS